MPGHHAARLPIVGEAALNLSAEFKVGHPVIRSSGHLDIPWQIAGFRQPSNKVGRLPIGQQVNNLPHTLTA